MIFISFLLDVIISSYLSFNTVLIPLFTLMTFIYIINNKNIYKLTLIVGVLYDVLYINTPFLNTYVFLFIVFILKKIDVKNISFKYILFINLLIIVFYKIIIYFVFMFFNKIDLSLYIILNEIKSSIIINLIYTSILYFINKKFKYNRTLNKNMI